jgi:hypothetical protein
MNSKFLSFCSAIGLLATSVCVGQQVDAEFRKIDTNGDGFIDPQEWNAYQSSRAKVSKSPPAAGGKTAISQSEGSESTTKSSETFLDQISKQISIRKSFLSADDESEPAKFSWTKNKGEDSIYTFDFALLLHPQWNNKTLFDWQHSFSNFILGWQLEPTFEAHISTDATSAQDSLSYRLPVTLDFQPNTDDSYIQVPNAGDAYIQGIRLIVSSVYETDQNANTRTLGGDIFVTPTIPKLGIGAGLPLGPLVFRWRPFVGFEGGNVIDDGGNVALRDTSDYFRFSLKLHTELWLNLWFPNQFECALDYYFREALANGTAGYNYLEVSPIFYFDERQHFSTGLTYKRGKTTPQFADVDTLTVWVGMKF